MDSIRCELLEIDMDTTLPSDIDKFCWRIAPGDMRDFYSLRTSSQHHLDRLLPADKSVSKTKMHHITRMTLPTLTTRKLAKQAALAGVR